MTGAPDAQPNNAMWPTVPRLLDENRYAVLGTADRQGRPWVSPVFFAAHSAADRLAWVSAPDSRHSRNLAERPEVAITVFDSHAPVGGAEALYLEATAGPALRAQDYPVLENRHGPVVPVHPRPPRRSWPLLVRPARPGRRHS